MKLAGLFDAMCAQPDSRRRLLAAVIIFACALAAYSNSFHAAFHFDDAHQIVQNRDIRDIANVPRFFVDAGTASSRPDLKGFRPVTLTSLALNFALFEYDVFGYHVLNFILHFINAFLVYLVVGLVLKAAGRKDACLMPLAVALIFALHPIQTGSVTYISGRSTLLATMFSLLAFYAFISYRNGSGRAGLFWAVVAPLSFVAGLLSKETAVVTLAFFVLYDVIFVMRGRASSVHTYRGWLYYLPLLALFAAYFFYRNSLLGFAGGGQCDHTPVEYLLSESKAFLLYLRLLVLPFNQNADYNMAATVSVDSTAVLSAVFVVSALVFLFRLRKKDPALAFFGLWFFMALAPESSFIPIEDIAVEYRLYLPSAGFIAVMALTVAGLIKNTGLRRGLAILLLIILGVLTFNRNVVWATDYTLWQDVVKKAPGSFRAHANYGTALMEAGHYRRAVSELQESLDINAFYDESFVVYNSLGLCYSTLGMPGKAEENFRLAISIYPQAVRPYRNLGELFYNTGRYGKAVDMLRQAAAVDPLDGQSRFLLAKAYTRAGRHREAVEEMERAVGMMPGNFFASFDLAVIYRLNGMNDKAVSQARASLPYAPDDNMKKRAEAFIGRLENGTTAPGGIDEQGLGDRPGESGN